jgi:exopolyphosphatase / guanosine-5'-triphosphate,3'-diphosphate pyrophosphatase
LRIAIIDCGTNTFNLLIIENPSPGIYRRVYNTRRSVKLGEGAINLGYIATEPFNRGLEALKEFKDLVAEYAADKLLIFATSAVRDAANGKEFVEVCNRSLGLNLEVIDGHREAELIYLGNREAVCLSNDNSLIMDIGGGSIEFIIANKEKIFWKESFALGAARLLDKFSPGSPLTQAEEFSMRTYLRENLSALFIHAAKFPPNELIGSSGAFDSIVEMIHGELNGEPLTDNKTCYDIDLEKYRHISFTVKKSSIEQRKIIKGLSPIRFDMIVISCVMIDFILEELGIKTMRVSTYSLKEGALVDFINKQYQ